MQCSAVPRCYEYKACYKACNMRWEYCVWYNEVIREDGGSEMTKDKRTKAELLALLKNSANSKQQIDELEDRIRLRERTIASLRSILEHNRTQASVIETTLHVLIAGERVGKEAAVGGNCPSCGQWQNAVEKELSIMGRQLQELVSVFGFFRKEV